MRIFDRPGDNVLVPDTPAAALYSSLVRLAGASPVSVPAAVLHDPASGQPVYGGGGDPTAWVEKVREMVTQNTGALVLASPCGVTGALLPSEYLAAAAALCRSLGIWLIVDQAHQLLVDPSSPPPAPASASSALSSSPAHYPSVLSTVCMGAGGGLRAHKVIMVGDVSFALGVGGWGVAHAVVGGGMGRGMESVLGGMRGSCGALASQHLMLAALKSPQVAEEVRSNVKRYCRVRRGVSLLLSKVPMCNLVFPMASGGLYVAVDVTPFGLTAQEVADVLLEEGGVCVVAVTHGGRQLIRLCISADEAALKDGVRKVAVTLMGLARDMLDNTMAADNNMAAD